MKMRETILHRVISVWMSCSFTFCFVTIPLIQVKCHQGKKTAQIIFLCGRNVPYRLIEKNKKKLKTCILIVASQNH